MNIRIGQSSVSDRRTLFTNPKHPYTKSLLKAIPGEELRGQKLTEIPGRVPPATAFPNHCRFADRCSESFGACRQQDPGLYKVESGHQAACLLYQDKEASHV